MEDTSRPASPEQNLWDSILNSVSTRRSIPSGNVLILGEPLTGKSTLANALLQRAPTDIGNENGEWFGKTDFALGYQWANVKEEGDEGLLALSPLDAVILTVDWTRRIKISLPVYLCTPFRLRMLLIYLWCLNSSPQRPHYIERSS